ADPPADELRVRHPRPVDRATRGVLVSRTIRADRLATATLWAIAILTVAILGAIIVHFLLAAIGTLSPSFVFGDPSDSDVGGVGPVLFNSLYMLVLTLLITVPLGT